MIILWLIVCMRERERDRQTETERERRYKIVFKTDNCFIVSIREYEIHLFL